MDRKNIIGARVREARKAKKLTQAQLAAKLEVEGLNFERTMVVKIENGVRTVMDYEVAALAKVLGVEVGWFYGAK